MRENQFSAGIYTSGEKSLDEFAQQLRTEHEQTQKKGHAPIFRCITVLYKGAKRFCNQSPNH